LRNLNRQTGQPDIKMRTDTVISEHQQQAPLPRERLRPSADSVEKERVAGAESRALNSAQAPFLSGFARLLRCRKDLG
jgi:hypothetical protein